MAVLEGKWIDILKKIGIESLNAMQERMMDDVLSGQNIMLRSPTGSGKTLAFLLPILHVINITNKRTQVLIVSPTRELAIQIHEVLRSMGTGITSTLCYGGHPIREEQEALSNDPQFVIGTPGRLHDHLRRGNIELGQLEAIVLDEYDKTLELGFEEDVKSIIQDSNSKARMILTSATKSLELPEYLNDYRINELNFINAQEEDSKLRLYRVDSPNKDKIDVLTKLLCQIGTSTTLVFLNHRAAVERVHELLKKRDIESAFFHGGLDQEERELTLLKFRNGSVRILVTTDLSARGLDIPAVEHVIHYQMPATEESFIHRNGRTARMHASGNAFVILSDEDVLKPFMPSNLETFQIENAPTPLPSEKITIALNRGKRDKISKMDVLGFLTKTGGLTGDQVGLISIKSRKAYAAISRADYQKKLAQLKAQKIKGKSVKIKAI